MKEKTVEDALLERENDKAIAEKWIAFYKENYPKNWLNVLKEERDFYEVTVYHREDDTHPYILIFSSRDFSIGNTEWNFKQFRLFKEKFPESEGFFVNVNLWTKDGAEIIKF